MSYNVPRRECRQRELPGTATDAPAESPPEQTPEQTAQAILDMIRQLESAPPSTMNVPIDGEQYANEYRQSLSLLEKIDKALIPK